MFSLSNALALTSLDNGFGDASAEASKMVTLHPAVAWSCSCSWIPIVAHAVRMLYALQILVNISHLAGLSALDVNFDNCYYIKHADRVPPTDLHGG